MSSHSLRAKTNMTAQMQEQWGFLQKNLTKKEKLLARNRKYFGRLPGFRWTITRQQRGIVKVKVDITKMKSRILNMQQDDQIFVIIPE